jgi:hypothetical protein
LFIADIILERNKDEKKGVEVRREWGGGGGSRRDGGMERGGGNSVVEVIILEYKLCF